MEEHGRVSFAVTIAGNAYILYHGNITGMFYVQNILCSNFTTVF